MKKLILSFIFCAAIVNANQAEAILNGGDPRPESYKYLAFVALLMDQTGTDKQQICTGTLLNKNTVLTSAACFKNKLESFTKITLIRAIHIESSSRTTQQISKSQIFIHPQYVHSTRGYDFAIIKLTEELPGMENVIYPLLSSSTNFEKFIFWGYGGDENMKYGALKTTSKYRDKILPILPGQEFDIRFDQTDLKGVSSGDLGSAVITPTGKQPYIVAVVSRTTNVLNGLDGSSTGIMTKVSTAMDWIQSYLGQVAITPTAPRSTAVLPSQRDSSTPGSPDYQAVRRPVPAASGSASTTQPGCIGAGYDPRAARGGNKP